MRSSPPRRARRLLAAAAALALPIVPALVAQETAEAEAAPPPGVAETLVSIDLAATGDEIAVVFTSSAPLGLVGVQRDPDGSVVVQFPDHVPGPAVADLFPASGPVKAVRVGTQTTARGPLTRAVLTPRVALDYTFAPEGRTLALRLRPAGSAPEGAAHRDLQRRLHAAEADLARAREAGRRLEERVGALTADRDLLAGRFEELEARRRGLEEALQATLAEVEAIAEASAAGSDADAERLAVLRAERDALAARVAELEGDLARARTTVDESDAQLEAWRAELDRLEQSDGGQAEPDERAARAEAARLAAEQRLAEVESELRRLRSEGLARGRVRSGVNLRRGPSTETEAMSLLPEGATVEILDRDGEWYRVSTGEREGWVYGLLLELESETVARLRSELEESRRERDALAGRLAGIAEEETAARLHALEAANAELEREVDRLRNEGVTRAVTTTDANLREGPGIDRTAVGALLPRTSVEVLERDGEWLHVRTGQADGWVYEKLLELESDAVARLRDRLAATESARAELEARLAEGGASPAAAPPGDGRPADLEAENRELRERLEAARATIGRLESEGVSRGRTLTGVHLREGPSVDTPSLTLIPADTFVEIVSKEAGWYRVRLGESEGWVFADLLTPVSDEIRRLRRELEIARQEVARLKREAPPGVAAPADPSVAWVLADVNLRAEPGVDHEVLGVLAAGTRVELLRSGQAWNRVRAGQLEGWVYRDFLDASKPADVELPAIDPSPAARTDERETAQAVAAAPPRPIGGVAGGEAARTLARLFLRTGPGTEHDPIALISEDTLVSVQERRGEWSRVVVRGTEGWMYGPLLASLD